MKLIMDDLGAQLLWIHASNYIGDSEHDLSTICEVQRILQRARIRIFKSRKKAANKIEAAEESL
jgi:hypothetical protein